VAQNQRGLLYQYRTKGELGDGWSESNKGLMSILLKKRREGYWEKGGHGLRSLSAVRRGVELKKMAGQSYPLKKETGSCNF